MGLKTDIAEKILNQEEKLSESAYALKVENAIEILKSDLPTLFESDFF